MQHNIKPISFSTAMVQAILQGRKTQTRRVIKPQPVWEERSETSLLCSGWSWTCKDHRWEAYVADEEFAASIRKHAPRKPGDVLWVRETWCLYECGELKGYGYKASGDSPDGASHWQDSGKWRPSIHMPKAAARLFLRVTDVRAERVTSISQEDSIAEGMYEIRPGGWFYTDPASTVSPNCTLGHTPKQAFMWLWNDLTAKGCHGWAADPWVWVYTFERCERPEGFPC